MNANISFPADIDDEVRAMALGKLQYALCPLGLRLVVDAITGAWRPVPGDRRAQRRSPM
jgi:hypothetical protein